MKTRCLAVLSGAILLYPVEFPAQQDETKEPPRPVRQPGSPEAEPVRPGPGPKVRRRVALPPEEQENEAEGKDKAEEKVEIFMPDVTLEEALVPMYEEISQCRVIVHPKLLGKIVTVASREKMTVSEGVVFCETSLLAAGVAVLETKPGTVVMLPFGEVEGNLEFAPPVVTERAQLPPGERIVDFVMPAKGLDAEKVRAFLAARLKEKAFTRIDAGPDGKSLVVRESAGTVRRMLEMIDALAVEAEHEEH